MSLRESIIELLAFNPLHTSHVKAMMTYVREMLENQSQSQQYPILNLYCNWLVHPEITKSAAAFDILRELTRAICDCNQRGKEAGDVWRHIINAIGIPALRQQLIAFFAANSISDSGFEIDDRWCGFANLMFQKLKDKRIYVVKKEQSQLIADLATSMGYPDWAIESLSITAQGDGLYWDISCPAIKAKNLKLIGPLGLI